MLIVHRSNRVEALVARLAALLAESAGDPLRAETVVVEGPGMARYAALAIASRLGVCANVEFVQPGAFVWRVARAVLGDTPRADAYTPEVVTWHLLALFDTLPEGDPIFAAPRAYLAGADPLARFGLAARVATLFDQYVVYRPDWVRRWEAGAEHHWQAELWRRLTGRAGRGHWARVQHRLLSVLCGDGIGAVPLPERIAVLGVATLSPAYLEVIAGLARHCDVHLLMLDPCREYWGDVHSARRVARSAAQSGPGTAEPRDLHLESGNRLLAALGGQARDFLDRALAVSALDDEEFDQAEDDTLLAAVQGDLLDLRDPAAAGEGPRTIVGGDRSLQIHVCHSRLREVEVLRDQLLDLLASNPDLSPAGMVVLAPDIDAYAPYLEAVFAETEPAQRIPLSIAAGTARGAVFDALLALFDLADSRFEIDRVLGLLGIACVRRRFGLGESDLERAGEWLSRAGVRWGVDGAARSALGLPAEDQNTWRAGLDRLLLGLALPPEGDQLYAGILPCASVEGVEAALLGHVARYAEALFSATERLRTPRPVSAWADLLHGLCTEFVAPEGVEEVEFQAVSATIQALADSASTAGYDAPVEWRVIRAWLVNHVPRQGSGARLPSGALACAGMVQGRAIPYQVVCVLGLNDGEFPRGEHPPNFDLRAADYRPGDRLPGDDDRGLFLDALLAARRCLYLSYVGRDIRDDGTLPPSTLLSELLDYLARGFVTGDGQSADRMVVTVHPLQPFSPRYFRSNGQGHERLFSYSANLCVAGRAAAAVRAAPRPFLDAALPPPDEAARGLTPAELSAWLANPARALLRGRLGIVLREADAAPPTVEPFVVEGLDRYLLRQRLLERRLADAGRDTDLRLARAEGRVPHGVPGAVTLDMEAARVDAFAERVREQFGEHRLAPLEFDLDLAGLHLRGTLSGLGANGLLGYRLARLKASDRLWLWVHHLLLNHLRPAAVECVSRWLHADGCLTLKPVAEPLPILESLVARYREGQSRVPPFFPESAWAYAQALLGRGRGDPLSRARSAWQGDDYHSGEHEDPYFALIFESGDPLDDDFTVVAEAVFGPLIECLSG